MKKIIISIVLIVLVVLIIIVVGISDNNKKNLEVTEFNIQFEEYKRTSYLWSRCTNNNK